MSEYATLKLDQILVEDRLRSVNQDFAAGVASSIEISGQQQPIVVRRTNAAKKPYTLVDGAHRYQAMVLLGWGLIEARIDDLDKDKARLVEIDTGLMRANLVALDRAIFLAERKEVYERLYPETKHGGDRKSDQVAENCHLNFTAETADRLDVGERSIRDAVMIAKRLLPSTVEALHGSPEANNTSRLLKLARMETKDQKMAVELFKETADLASSMTQAEGGKQVKKKPDAELKYEGLCAAWEKAPVSARKKFVSLVSDDLKAMLEGA